MNVSSVSRKISTNLFGIPDWKVHRLLPGLVLAAVLAWVSIQVSHFVGTAVLGFAKSPISSVMTAILLGLILGNLIPLPKAVRPGLTFSVKKVLRLGIILLGIRLSIFDVFKLGAMGVPIVVLCIVGALLLTTRLAVWLRLPERLGTLIAVGTSICGVSAIVSTAPAIEAEEEEVAYAVAVITVFGLLATLVYPYVTYLLFAGDPVKVGLFLGTSIHDTSQVTGAALVYADVFGAPRALDVATVTKLVRNVFMALVIPFMAFRYASRTRVEGVTGRTSIARLLPLFIVGFLAMAVVRSIGDAGVNAGGYALGLWDTAAWTAVYKQVQTWAVNLLVVALAGVGLSTSLESIKGLGVKPFLVGLGAALTVGGISFGAVSVAGMFGAF